MKVFQRLAHAFKAEGVDATFGMMGDGNMFWLHEMHKLGIKVHEVRHEGAGLGMADGYARTSRRVGVATATCGPGTSQLATAFVTAARAESPLVAFCGEYPVGDPEYSQRLDQSAFAHGCEAAFVRMGAADQADEAVRKAFYIAKTESRPVLLSVPMDLQQEQWEDDDPYVPSATMMRPGIVHPDPEMIKRAADMIASAKKPVIIMGRGAQWSNAGQAALKLGDRIGALIHEPRMLLLDEPFGALDAFTREELWSILRELWLEQRFNVVLVTHDLRESVFLADTVYVMSKSPGRFVVRKEIDLPQDRDLEITYTSAFSDIVHELRSHIGAIRKPGAAATTGATP